MRLIDADALNAAFLDYPKMLTFNGGLCAVNLDAVLLEIRRTPTIEAEPVRHGRWDDTGRYTFADGSLAIRCTECGAALHLDEWEKYCWDYCPCCGAKMDGESHE